MSYLSSAQKLRPVIETAMDKVDDNTALEAPQLSKIWKEGEYVKPGDRRYYAPTQKLYKVRDGQGHTTQADWTPDTAASLWSVAADPTEEWPAWSQPVGAHDAYAKGDKVSHNGKHWTSSVDSNVWEPGVYGWTEATE